MYPLRYNMNDIGADTMKRKWIALLLAACCIIAVILFIKVNNDKKKQQDLEWAISNYHSYTGDAQKAIRLFSEVMDTVEGRKLYDMHRAVRDRDFASAAVQFLDYKEEGGRLNPDWWLSTICHAAEKLDDPSAQLTALYDAYVPSLACQTETMDNWFRLWMDRSCAYRRGFLFGHDKPDRLLTVCGGKPDGSVLIWDNEDGALISAMATLDISLWPKSLAGVEYLLKLERIYTKVGKYYNGAIGYHTDLKVSLVHLPNQEVLYTKTLTGGDPPNATYSKTEVYGSLPADKDIIAAIRSAFSTISISLRD